jgi:hypothetical protein
MDDLSGGSFVKGHIGGLCGPEMMQQDRQLTGYSDNRLVPGLLADNGSDTDEV